MNIRILESAEINLVLIMPYSSMMCVCMYTVNVSIKIVKEHGSDGKNLTKQPRPVLSFLKNLISVVVRQTFYE